MSYHTFLAALSGRKKL